MGIYVQTYAKRPKKKLFGKPLETQIINAARSWSNQFGVGDFFYEFEVSPKLVNFTFFPLNESIQFVIEEDLVSIGLKTSTVGAGYHSAFINLCDFLQEKVGLVWQWQLSGGESGDESGYAVDRDFDKLRSSHFEQVMGIMKHFKKSDHNDFLIHCDTNLTHDFTGVAGPRGYISEELIEAFYLDEKQAIFELWDKLTIWNQKPLDEAFWLATLEGLLWHEFPWRMSANEYEEYVEKCVRSSAQRISHDKIPKDLQIAIGEFEHFSKTVEVPDIEGIGYKRKRLRRGVTGPWICHVPGYLVQSWDDENNTVQFMNKDIELRGSSLSVEYSGNAEKPFDWPETFNECENFNVDGFDYRLPETVKALDDGYYFGMGMGVTPIKDHVRHIIQFSVTALSQNIVLKELDEQFKNGIRLIEDT